MLAFRGARVLPLLGLSRGGAVRATNGRCEGAGLIFFCKRREGGRAPGWRVRGMGVMQRAMETIKWISNAVQFDIKSGVLCFLMGVIPILEILVIKTIHNIKTRTDGRPTVIGMPKTCAAVIHVQRAFSPTISCGAIRQTFNTTLCATFASLEGN